MSHHADSLWARFADRANWGQLHPHDWDRFYGFVAQAHADGVYPDEGDLRDLIERHPDAKGTVEAKILPTIYRHCRGVLQHQSFHEATDP